MSADNNAANNGALAFHFPDVAFRLHAVQHFGAT